MQLETRNQKLGTFTSSNHISQNRRLATENFHCSKQGLSPQAPIRSRILTIRGVQVILSSDLAPLYDVEVKYLHRQVKRNTNRFPPDFVLHLSPEEASALRC
ncbi:MAG: ORF6N domain-containing protein, partial [Kiritimatiellae bacterium]|nr:ORF6N domain-containing protein [Kiritimatiellia bacterium]